MRADRLHRCVVALLSLLLTLPILATLLYSLSTRWEASILPEGLTLDWHLQLWHDARFLTAFAHSLLICAGTLLLATLVIVPAAFVVFYRFPRADRWMNVLILTPFSMPPVVASVGLLQLFADGSVQIVGTPWILIGSYFTIALPFMYRALADSLRGLDVAGLMDAACLLGASTPRAFMQVILPNLRKALMASLFLSFSLLFGEFVFANMLVGARYETLQVYLYSLNARSGHFTSALVMNYFLCTLVLTWLANRLGRSNNK
ncbi:ABC transporter permease [Burkholderia sp. Bp8963]|uniref:ABC transporter permease n=1 Tax=Burkholderia sp. Bp8963 TaxID=2184547 RepID=UPI000F595EA0|nr:ABC transporter permease [Burkholderia sp. Bp8963]RQS67732.1 ABC transporter permease [Burkholderia sp. Bp8963]